jgi:hypothetical protein
MKYCNKHILKLILMNFMGKGFIMECVRPSICDYKPKAQLFVCALVSDVTSVIVSFVLECL